MTKINIFIVILVVMALAFTDARPTRSKPNKVYAVKTQSNPHFRPNATRQVFRAWKKFAKHAHSSVVGNIDLSVIPLTDVRKCKRLS